MISIDTNILLYAHNRDCPEHERAFNFILSCGGREDVALCELVLVELYILLRNPTVLRQPLPADQAAEVCRTYRRNARWRLVENAPVMEQVWTLAGQPEFARRRIFDARIALTLLHHGVTELYALCGFARDISAVCNGRPGTSRAPAFTKLFQ